MNIEQRTRSAAEEEQLIQDNIRLAYYFLHKFHLAYDDEAVDIALEGLWNAARTYDDSKGSKFATYASVCIYNALGMYVRRLKRCSNHETRSLEEYIHENLTLADTLSTYEDPESLHVASDEYYELHAAFAKVIEQASTPKHREVIELWYKSGGTMTQCAIAKATGFSQSFVSRILSMTKHKLRLELEEQR